MATVVKNPLAEGVLGPYDPSKGIEREQLLQRKALGTALGNVFRNMLDVRGASQGAMISPINSNKEALAQYNKAIEDNLRREDQLNALRLQDAVQRSAEDRQYGRQIETEGRQQDWQVKTEDRGENRQIRGELRGEQRQIAGEQRGEQRQLSAEERAYLRQQETEQRGEQRQIAGEGRQQANAIQRMREQYRLEDLQIGKRYAEMKALEDTKQKAKEGYIQLYSQGPGGALQYVTDVDEGFANSLVSEIIKNPEALKEYDALKASFNGVTAEAKKLLIANHWDKVKHLVYGGEPSDTANEPIAGDPLINQRLGQTKQEKKQQEKDMIKGKAVFDDFFTSGTK